MDTPRHAAQTVTVFGAAGPTGMLVCLTALAAGHTVRAVSRRDDPIPLPASDRFVQVKADAVRNTGVENAVLGADAVLSTLGCAYRWSEISVYSLGTQHIVESMRRVSAGRRLVVVSSGLTYEPPKLNWPANTLLFPLLRNVVGRTLYADMRCMESVLQEAQDMEWTVMRPGRLYNAPAPSAYRLDADEPSQGWTARADLAAAMVAELRPSTAHVHQAMAPTTTRRKG